MLRPPSAPQLHLDELEAHPSTGWDALPGADRVRFAYSGRAAIYQLFAALQPRLRAAGRSTVLVPAFHCPTVVDPVVHAGFDVQFYGIGADLEVMREDLMSRLDGRVAAVIFVRMFGVTRPAPELVGVCRSAGALVVEDCAHSFLDADPIALAGREADAAIYSFWKLVPSVVGGGVLLRDTSGGIVWPLQRGTAPRDSVRRLRTLAGEALDGICSQGRSSATSATRAAEIARPVVYKPAAEAYPYSEQGSLLGIPWSARQILRRSRLDEVVARRRRNYAVLSRVLARRPDARPAVEALPAWSCPWGLPLLLERRHERDYLIRARGVAVFTFGEVLHPALHEPGRASAEARDAAEHLCRTLLGLSIHQQLDEAYVETAGNVVNAFLADEAPTSRPATPVRTAGGRGSSG